MSGPDAAPDTPWGLARWLVSLDGSDERRTVTLGQIIGWARAALDSGQDGDVEQHAAVQQRMHDEGRCSCDEAHDDPDPGCGLLAALRDARDPDRCHGDWDPWEGEDYTCLQWTDDPTDWCWSCTLRVVREDAAASRAELRDARDELAALLVCEQSGPDDEHRIEGSGVCAPCWNGLADEVTALREERWAVVATRNAALERAEAAEAALRPFAEFLDALDVQGAGPPPDGWMVRVESDPPVTLPYEAFVAARAALSPPEPGDER